MKKLSTIGIYVLLLTIVGLSFKASDIRTAYNNEVVCGSETLYNTYYLKEIEAHAKELVSFEANSERKRKYNRQYMNFAKQDPNRFFKKEVPLGEPNVSTPFLFTWAAFAASDALTFGYDDYKTRMAITSDYFDSDGWASLIANFKERKVIPMIEENKQVVTAVPTDAPVILSEGRVAGYYNWLIDFPMVLNYRSGEKTSSEEVLVTMVIRRSDDKRHPYGLAIEELIVSTK